MKYFFLFITLCITHYGHSQTYHSGTVFGGSGLDIPIQSAVDSQNNLYTVGLFQSSITLGDSSVTTVGGNSDGFVTKHDAEGNPVWVKSFGSPNDDAVFDITIDAQDNLLITGYFQGSGDNNSFDADPGPGVYLLSQPSFILSRDCFIIKLTNDGEFIWAKQISNPFGAANEDAHTIEVDSQGNIFLAGSFIFADFDPDPNVTFEVFANNDTNNENDAFLLKLNSNGEFVWVKTFPATSFASISDMEFDANDNLYITGRFKGTIDLDASPDGTESHTSGGDFDIFIVKLDENQDFMWGGTLGGNNNDISTIIKIYDSGLYVGGYFSGTTDFDLSNATEIHSPMGDTDGFICQYSTAGDLNFAYTIGDDATGLGLERVDGIRATDSTIYVSGSFLETVDFDNSDSGAVSTSMGGTDVFLLELSNEGQYQNHYTIGGSNDEDGRLETLSSNEVILYGSYKSPTIDLNPFEGEDIHNINILRDVYISRFSLENTVGIEDYSRYNSTIYPNPSTNEIFIRSEHIFQNYEIFSTTGRLLLYGRITDQGIDISSLSQGMYLVNLVEGQTRSSSIFIKD